MLAVIGKACDLIARNPRVVRFRTKRSLKAHIRSLESDIAALARDNPKKINRGLLLLFCSEIERSRHYLSRGALEKATQYCSHARDTRHCVERALKPLPPRRRRNRLAVH